MSDTPINLNKVRKARARAAKKAQAQANTVAFGRSKAEREEDARAASRVARDLDGKALETPPYGSDEGDKKP